MVCLKQLHNFLHNKQLCNSEGVTKMLSRNVGTTHVVTTQRSADLSLSVFQEIYNKNFTNFLKFQSFLSNSGPHQCFGKASINFTACLARSIYYYKNLRTKFMNCWSNKYSICRCKIKDYVPRYDSKEIRINILHLTQHMAINCL